MYLLIFFNQVLEHTYLNALKVSSRFIYSYLGLALWCRAKAKTATLGAPYGHQNVSQLPLQFPSNPPTYGLRTSAEGGTIFWRLTAMWKTWKKLLTPDPWLLPGQAVSNAVIWGANHRMGDSSLSYLLCL